MRRYNEVITLVHRGYQVYDGGIPEISSRKIPSSAENVAGLIIRWRHIKLFQLQAEYIWRRQD